MPSLGKARVPTDTELKRLFGVTRAGKHARRNAAMLTVSYRLGLRAKEIAALCVKDVLDGDGRLRDECLNEHLFASLPEARKIIEEWRTDYNTLRPHTSLNGLTPTEFATRPMEGHNRNGLSS